MSPDCSLAVTASEPTASKPVGRHRWRPRLAARILLRTVPVIFLIVLLTQGGLRWRDYQDQVRQLETRTEMIAELTADALARPLWMLDRSIYAAQVKALEQDPAFLLGRILDASGREVLAIGAPPQQRALTISRDIISPQGEVIGSLELTMSREELRRAFNREILLTGLAFVILLAGFTLSVHYAVRDLVIRPLEQMLQAMAGVERKNWLHLGWERSDELGRAGRAFDKMVEGLRSGDEAKRLLAALEQTQKALVEKNQEIEAAHQQLTENLAYASRIQMALMPSAEDMERHFAEAALLWRPLQAVGGDHCWLLEQDGRYILFMADCTGHGVPGAFMTLIAAAALDEAVRQTEEMRPSALLHAVDRLVRQHLSKGANAGADDGLDAACCIYDPDHRQLHYAGANIPLLVQHGGQVEMIRATRGSLGYQSLLPPAAIRDHTIPVLEGMCFYLFTDGVPEQVGGPGVRPRLFGRQRLRAFLQEQRHRPLKDQAQALEAALADWRGEQAQRDDYAFLAFRAY